MTKDGMFETAGELAHALLANPDFEVEVTVPDYKESEWPCYRHFKITQIADIGYSSKLILLDGEEIK